MFIGFDPLYLVLMAPALALSLIATGMTKSRFRRYAQVPSERGLTGAQVAELLLRRAGLGNVRVVEHDGFLSDHYDPRVGEVRLSPDVYAGRSISATAVAAHETGHAMQHATEYWPLTARARVVPVANLGSNLSYIIIIAGLILHILALAYVGVVLFTAVVAFQVITLPVEFNASARAKKMLVEYDLIAPSEQHSVSQVLTAAAMTYVAAAASAILTLLYFMIRTGLLGGRSRDNR